MNKFIIPIVFIKTEGMKVYMNMQVQIERKLVMIARVTAQERKIIVLDEPATYLDLENQIKILKLIFLN